MSDVGMGPRPLLAMVLGWLAIVVAVGAITFVVVDRAGRGVGQASAAEVVAVASSPPPRPVPSSPGPAADPSDTAWFSSEGGTVVASCDGTRMTLESIRPRDGWRFEKETEEGGLEVVFRSGGQRVDLLLGCRDGVPTRLSRED